MKATISSATIEATVDETGAELTSLKSADGTEYLWGADPAVWDRHSPILFPIVGRLRNGTYEYGGASYSLPLHGFASGMNSSMTVRGRDAVSCRFESDEKTRRCYPFDFSFDVSYRVEGSTLSTSWLVRNTGKGEMLFSIGAHPGFNCPLAGDGTMEDYLVEFDEAETAERLEVTKGLFSTVKIPFLEDARSFALSERLFVEDAIVFEDLRSRAVTLRNGRNSRSVRVEFPGFPFLGIWSKPSDAPFVCIEPWCGIGDSVSASGILSEKKGIMRLEPGERFERELRITIA